MYCVEGEVLTLSGKEKTNQTHKLKASVKTKVYSDCLEEQKIHLDTLLKQGEYLKFADQEKVDPNWNSIIFDLPKGTMKFLLNSFTRTLPTQDNLELWGKTFSHKCHLCKNRDSTTHCLNGCRVSLNQVEFTWRHNNIVNYIVQSVDTSQYKVHSDLPRHETSNGRSLPPSMVVTNLKPDIVIIDDKKKEDKLFELTCPIEHNIHKQHIYKSDEYAHFETDIKTHKTTVCAFEVGSRATLINENIARLSSLHKYLKRHIKKSTFIKKIKALSTLSSYYIFTARKNQTWDHTAFINPPLLGTKQPLYSNIQ